MQMRKQQTLIYLPKVNYIFNSNFIRKFQFKMLEYIYTVCVAALTQKKSDLAMLHMLQILSSAFTYNMQNIWGCVQPCNVDGFIIDSK